MHISVVVPFYNAERYIGDCIQSLLSQDYPRAQYEIILVDNNSNDASAEVVRRYPEVKLISETKQGAYSARNRGVAEATGELIAFTDPDCLAARDWLKNLSKAMESGRRKVAVGKREPASDTSILCMVSDYENTKDEFVFASDNKEIYYGHTNNMAVCRDLFDSIGPFVERQRGGDAIFVRSVVEEYSCDAVAFVPDASVRHLELDSLQSYYRKVSIYAGGRRRYQSIFKTRALTIRQRLQIFHRVVRTYDYSFARSVLLFTLLGIGMLYWVLGDLRARWPLPRRPKAGVT